MLEYFIGEICAERYLDLLEVGRTYCCKRPMARKRRVAALSFLLEDFLESGCFHNTPHPKKHVEVMLETEVQACGYA